MRAGMEAPQGIPPLGINLPPHSLPNHILAQRLIQEMQHTLANLLAIQHLVDLPVNLQRPDIVLLATRKRIECALIQ